MQFKAGDKVKYIGCDKRFVGCSGIITRVCPIIGPLCYIVRMSNGLEQHLLTKYLKLNQKNQQLLFEFME